MSTDMSEQYERTFRRVELLASALILLSVAAILLVII